MLLFVGGLILFLMGLGWGGSRYPWRSAHVIATIIVGACSLVAFVLYGNELDIGRFSVLTSLCRYSPQGRFSSPNASVGLPRLGELANQAHPGSCLVALCQW